jgi:hypothetical protein
MVLLDIYSAHGAVIHSARMAPGRAQVMARAARRSGLRAGVE